MLGFLSSLQLVLWGVNVGDLHLRGFALPGDSRGGTFQAAEGRTQDG